MYRFSTYTADLACTDGYRLLEIDASTFGAPLEALSPAAIEETRRTLLTSLSRVVLYTVDSDFITADLPALLRNAHLLNVENILVPDALFGDAGVREMADAMGVRLLMDYTLGCEGFYLENASANTGLVFDPASVILAGKNPYLSVLYKNKVKDDIVLLRVSDALKDGTPVLPGHGNAEVKECMSHLLCRSFGGYFSLSGYRSFDRAAVAAEAVRLLSEM